MVPEAEAFMEWLVANRQNAVEWVLLYSKDWPHGQADGAERKGRLRRLTDLAHAYGLEAGEHTHYYYYYYYFYYFY
jgi:hypothetical protein